MLSDKVPYIRKVYTGVGNYTFDFKTFSTDDLYIFHTDSEGNQTDLTTGQYNAILNLDFSGGTIEITDVTLAYPGFITFQRVLPYAQETDWVNNDPFSMELLERTQDRLVMMIQQIRYIIASSTSAWRGTWFADTPYTERDFIIGPDESWYACIVAHTSTIFIDDVAAGHWTKALPISEFNTYYNTVIDLAEQVTEDKISSANSASEAISSADAAAASAAIANQLTELVEVDATSGEETVDLSGLTVFNGIKMDATANEIVFEDTSGEVFVYEIKASQQWEIFKLRLTTAGWVRV